MKMMFKFVHTTFIWGRGGGVWRRELFSYMNLVVQEVDSLACSNNTGYAMMLNLGYARIKKAV